MSKYDCTTYHEARIKELEAILDEAEKRIEELTQLLAFERDLFGKLELKLMAELRAEREKNKC